MSPILMGVIGLAGFFLLALFGMPLAFAFATVGLVGVIAVKGLLPGLALIGSAPFAQTASYSLVALPLFILMGQFAFRSGIGRDLYNAAYNWLGRLPGGLALATMVACTGFAACTGSSVASAATMATLSYPEMERLNYNRRLSTACIATGGTLGNLIPPSTLFIVYGVMTETSIGALFIAGILPGLMLSTIYMTVILVLCKRNPQLGPPGEHVPWRQKFASLTGVWGVLALALLVIGGLYFGVFSPSEAGAIGGFGAFLIVILRRRLTKSVLHDTLLETARTTCLAMLIIVGAMIFNTFITTTGFGTSLAMWVSALPLSPIMILIAILVIYIPLGCVMDSFAMIMLTLPIFFPTIESLGFDPVWFGILITVMMEMGLLTPPVGINAFVVHGVTKVPVGEIFRGLVPFILAMCLGVALLVAFPQISLFLPHIMR